MEVHLLKVFLMGLKFSDKFSESLVDTISQEIGDLVFSDLAVAH